jgi:hypothetical protein
MVVMGGKDKSLTINQIKFIEDILSFFIDKAIIKKVDVDVNLYSINILPKDKNLSSFTFFISKENSEFLIFINDVKGAYYEGNIEDVEEIKDIIKTVLKSKIKIESFYRKGKNISKKIYLYIDGKEIDTFLYTERLFWKFLYKEKKEKIYQPWIE